MSIYAIGDLHLSLNREKPMDIFGGNWKNHEQKVKENWKNTVQDNDLVILPGDFSWEMHLKDMYNDFAYLNELPGKKLLLKGNHDYWWTTLAKMREFLQENNLVNEILSVNLNEGRVARRQLSSNTPVEEVRQYLANLVARKQQLTNYENQLKDRKKVIDEIIERKGLSNKKKVKPKKKVDKNTKVASSTAKDIKEIETVGSTNAKEVKSKKLVTTKKTSVKTSSDKKDISVEPKKQKGKDLVVVTKTSKSSSSSKPKQKTLKVVNHKMTANLEKLGKVNKAKKPSAIITKKKTETKASSNTKKKTTKTTNSKTKSKNK